MQLNKILQKYPFVISMFFLPSMLLVGVFIIYPLLNGVYLSFTNASPLEKSPVFVGFDNFTYLLEDPEFWEVLYNSVLIVGSSIISALVLGFALALLLNSKLRASNFFRTGVFQVWIVPWITIAVLWGWLFNADYGIINYILVSTGIIKENLNWFARPHLAQFVIILAFTWRMIPLMMVISLAALQSIPQELLEAAAIDGANYLRRLRYVMLPMVRNILLILSLLQTVRVFQEITLPWILTHGGPVNATMTLSIYTFKIAFEMWDFGLASTVGTIWLIVLIMFGTIYVKLFLTQNQEN